MKSGNEIKKYLKENGIDTKNVSVSTRNGSYDITIKSILVNKTRVKELMRPFEKIDRCHATGDILQGGNTFVIIQYDYCIIGNYIEANNLVDQVATIVNEHFTGDFPKRSIVRCLIESYLDKLVLNQMPRLETLDTILNHTLNYTETRNKITSVKITH